MKPTKPMSRSIAGETANSWQKPSYTVVAQRRSVARWLHDNLEQVAIWGFAISIAWTFYTAVGLNYDYQDTWILEGIWQPLTLVLGFYLFTIYKDLDPGPTAVLTALFVFTVYSVSTLKYAYIYGSTIDNSIHFSMMRKLAETGRFDDNVYAFTPGLHLLVASLAHLSGISVTHWAKVVPAFMGGLIPLSVYLLCNRLEMPRLLLRSTVILSALSLPLLPLLDGTSFAILIFSPLLSIAILWSISEQKLRQSLTAMILLLGLSLIVWHAISSMLIPLVLGLSGLFSLGFAWLWKHIAYQPITTRRAAAVLMFLGIIGLAMTLLYWRMVATPIWEHLVRNVRIFLDVVETTEPSEGVLIPARTFTLRASELVITLLIYHARDAVMMALVGLGGIFNLHALYRSWKTRSSEDRYEQVVRVYAIIWIFFCGVLVATLAFGFAKHGYQRFILYIMAVSMPIAGYGLWKAAMLFHGWFPRISPHALVPPIVALAFLLATAQLFPYQPMVPRARLPETDGTTPLFWHHQVNTEYQRFGINFAFNQVDEEFTVFTDYRTYHQAGIFLDLEAKSHFHYGYWPQPRPAYVLLHRVGVAGGYSEQAEYRSPEAIQARRDLEGVNTVYDNGATFLMFVPERHLEKMYLEFTGNE